MLYIVCLLALLLLQHKLLETELDVVFLCLNFLFSFELVVGLLAVLQVVTEAHLLALLLPLLLEQLLLRYLNMHFLTPDFLLANLKKFQRARGQGQNFLSIWKGKRDINS